jgi:ADP-dependent NAD(P)H-hydrate dehydratase / NAD(P)H-hydrate epimerase
MKMTDSHPVLTCAAASAWEKRLLKGESSEWKAMQKAGEKIAEGILCDFKEIGELPDQARLLVLVGKGHNGGDALLAAQRILERYPEATADILFCFGESLLRPLTKQSFDGLYGTAGERCRMVKFGQLKAGSASYDLCLDGVFGFQFRPPMDRAIARTIGWINANPRIKFRAAVDLPSGLGEGGGPKAFRADFTYATGIVKTPVVAESNGVCVGRLRYLDLGFFAAKNPKSDQRVLTGQLLAPLTELRSSQSDKRTFGHLCVVGGSHSYPGAIMLAVRAAMRSGVGLVTAFVPESLTPHYAATHPEVMWVGCPLNSAGGLALSCLPLLRERLKKADAMLVGPGLGADPETIELVRRIASEVKVPILLDADALRPEVIRELKRKAFVCTPHAGEFKRIAPALYSGKRFVNSRGVLVLKGPLTHVTDGKIIYYSPFGGPVLARGGSGDMLAGLIGGLLAQKPDDPLLAACRGLVWHGVTADLLARTQGQVAVENSQLLEQLGPALQSTHGRHIDGATGIHGPQRPA